MHLRGKRTTAGLSTLTYLGALRRGLPHGINSNKSDIVLTIICLLTSIGWVAEKSGPVAPRQAPSPNPKPNASSSRCLPCPTSNGRTAKGSGLLDCRGCLRAETPHGHTPGDGRRWRHVLVEGHISGGASGAQRRGAGPWRQGRDPASEELSVAKLSGCLFSSFRHSEHSPG